MFNFADLLRQAQGGEALDNISRAFGLGRSDLERLTAAFLPMMAIGLQRRAQTASLADLLDPATFRAAYQDARTALSPAATEAGRMALETIFGSPAAARVVADQAAEISGIGDEVVLKILPAMTATLLGGIAQEAAAGPLGPFLKAWAGGHDPATAPLAAFGQPFKGAMDAFLRGYATGKPKPAPNPPDPWREGLEGWQRLFDAGVELTEQNRKAFEQLLDAQRPKRGG